MAATASPKIITDGLQLLLDANNPKSYPGTGATWFDISGNGYHFTLLNSPTFNPNEGSFTFTNSLSQSASYTLFPFAFAGSTNFTFGIHTYYVPSTSNDGIVMSPGGAFNAGGVGLEMRFRNGGPRLEYTVGDASSSGIRLLADPTVAWGNRWSMIWVRHTAQSTATLYDRGTPVATQSYLGESPVSTIYGMSVGRGYDTFYNGRIAAVYLYNRLLSEDEILQNNDAVKGRFGY